jgi:2-keto-4-pentenoate hydratase
MTETEETMRDDVAKAAQFLMDAHTGGLQFRSFAKDFQIATLNDAYAVQRDYVSLQMSDGKARPAGYKIGLTSPRMQAMCGIDSPIAGVILNDRVHMSGIRLQSYAYGRPGLEFEIAVRLGRDLGRSEGRVGLAEVADAIDAVCPAVEIVDDRNADYATLDVLSLVADNSWNAGIILGAFQSPWPDLAATEGIVSLNEEIADRGFGRDVLGHPFRSVAWLAGHLAESGERLRAGDIVMTGSLVTTKFPTETSRWRFDVEGLGSVDLSIEV